MNDGHHVPVMLKEVVQYLEPAEGQIVIDATFGFGGHAREIAKSIGGAGKLIGFERDDKVFKLSGKTINDKNYILLNENFINMRLNLEKLNIHIVDAVYFDLGISTFHYRESGKGFSFGKDEGLDMRLDGDIGPSAKDLVNGLSEKELADLFYNLAEEYKSRQIAKAIVERRRKNKIETTKELAEIIEKTVARKGKIHPATKVFQALRIAVNDELNNIEVGIDQAVSILKKGGRILIITFHSGEDRIVKNKFKALAKEGMLEIITKKPVVPSREEIAENPPSRSAKIRVARRV